MRAALEAFGDGGGDIVNTASLSGLGPVPGYGVYAATKAAIVSVSMSVDAETPRNVRVHALCPDGVQTALLDGQTPGSLATRLVHSGARILTVEEVARAAVELVGSRRVVLSVPRWRGALVRGTALAPSVAKRACGCSRPRAGATSPSAAPERSDTRSNKCSTSFLELVRTRALTSYMCSIERLIERPPEIGPSLSVVAIDILDTDSTRDRQADRLFPRRSR